MIDLTTVTLHNMKKFIKKPIPIQAIQINEPFIVDTLEGRHTGNAGDYCVIGIRGERYPVKRDIFEESYEEV
jgi:hypothetical protein